VPIFYSVLSAISPLSSSLLAIEEDNLFFSPVGTKNEIVVFPDHVHSWQASKAANEERRDFFFLPFFPSALSVKESFCLPRQPLIGIDKDEVVVFGFSMNARSVPPKPPLFFYRRRSLRPSRFLHKSVPVLEMSDSPSLCHCRVGW